jgi:uncharacterized protein (TIGR02145 family)
MGVMFAGCSLFNQDISNWNVSGVTNMDGMFINCNLFNQDLSSWCVSLIPSIPVNFDNGATSWVLPRPIWGTCPGPTPTPTPTMTNTQTPTATETLTQTPTPTPTPTNPCPNCVAQDITIGSQTWTKCNLDVSTYANGDTIPEVTDPTVWTGLTTGAWCYYNNDSANGVIYGKLYNWYAVSDPRGLAPAGYHIPTDAEWTTLTDYLGSQSIAGGKMKETGLCHWLTPNTNATNESGFTALPGGYRFHNSGVFNFITTDGYWWSSTDSSNEKYWNIYLRYNSGELGMKEMGDCGYVRCVKN